AFGTTAIPWYDFAGASYVMSFGADFLDTWLAPVAFQNGFARAHAFEAGRDASMAKFVFVGPRLSLAGMNADDFLNAAPGTEGLLALAMAQVILSRRLAPAPADAARLGATLAAFTPERVAQVLGVEAEAIVRHATDFARSGSPLAVA